MLVLVVVNVPVSTVPAALLAPAKRIVKFCPGKFPGTVNEGDVNATVFGCTSGEEAVPDTLPGIAPPARSPVSDIVPASVVPFCVKLTVTTDPKPGSPFDDRHAPARFGPTVTDTAGAVTVDLLSLTLSVTWNVPAVAYTCGFGV